MSDILIFGRESRHHMSPLLRDCLNWQCIHEWVTFKLCLLMYIRLFTDWDQDYLADILVSLSGPKPLYSLLHTETLMFHKHEYCWKVGSRLFLLLVQLCRTTCQCISAHLSHWQCSTVAQGTLVCCILYRVRTIMWKPDSPIVDTIGQNNRPMR